MRRDEFSILVVDDDTIARDVVVSLLQKEGYPVDSASDGLEAIRKLQRNAYHMVITDLKMPGADGIDVLKESLRVNPDIAVVIITAYGTLENALEAIKIGAYDYITKPFKLQELLIVVENARQRAALLLENRQLRQSLVESYRSVETAEEVSEKGLSEMVGYLEKLARLRDMGLLSDEEVGLLKERIMENIRNAEGAGSR
ncbi:MAG: response regulator [Nitrospirae bacterium]|nr:MAG: response regulator [Nitrospirota bacterium]